MKNIEKNIKKYDFKTDERNEFISKADLLSKTILNRKNKIIEILCEIEAYRYACDEIKRSVEALKNIYLEQNNWINKTNLMAVFLPINQPLYSLILFATVPSILSMNIIVRPSADTYDVVYRLFNILKIEEIMPNIKIFNSSRRDFIDKIVTIADCVIFIGKYENALDAYQFIKKSSLFLYSGSGMNPFLITKNADLKKAVTKGIEARVYNSGQDCVAPRVFMINEKNYRRFVSLVVKKIKKLNCGLYDSKKTHIGPLIRKDSFIKTICLLADNSHKIIYGGDIDISNKIISPTILEAKITDSIIFEEMYAPIFVLVSYANEGELKQYFCDRRYRDYEMYVSIFGSLEDTFLTEKSVCINSLSVLDYEKGNFYFGGYGKKTNFVMNKNNNKPFIISEEVKNFLI